MNVMIDTNVILDDILGRAPNADTARNISRLVTDGVISGYLKGILHHSDNVAKILVITKGNELNEHTPPQHVRIPNSNPSTVSA